jgi:hypothetical protein
VNPDFAQRHPVATSILGFIGDVAIDPTTYLSFGETNAVQHLVTDGTIGLDRAAVRKAAIEAGVKTSKFDALGKLVGRPSASAEKALAKESERAVGQFFEHQLGKVEEEATTDAKKLAEEHAKAVAEHATEQKAALSEFVSGESSEHQRATRSKKAVDEFFGAGGGNGQVNLLDPETFQAKVQQLATQREERYAAVTAKYSSADEFTQAAVSPGTPLADRRMADTRAAAREFFGVQGPEKPVSGGARGVVETGAAQARGAEMLRVKQEADAAAKGLLEERAAQQARYSERKAKDATAFPVATGINPDPPMSIPFDTSSYDEALVNIQARKEKKTAELMLARKAVTGKVFTSSAELTDALGTLVGHEQAVTAIWRSPEQRLQAVLTDPEMLEKLKDKGGVKVLGRTVIPNDVLKKAGELTGVSSIFDRLDKMKKSLPLWLRSRDAPIGELDQAVQLQDGSTGKIGQLYLQARNTYNSLFRSAPHKAWRETLEHFQGLKVESREKIGKLLWDMDDAASGHGMGAGLQGADRDAAINQLVANAKLTPKEHAGMAFYRQRMAEIGAFEKDLGILEHLHENYFHRVLNPKSRAILAEGADAEARGVAQVASGVMGTAIDNKVTIPGPMLDAAKERSILSRAQAEKLGLEYSYDTALSYALRVRNGEQAVARKVFENRLREMFPDATISADGVVLKGVPLPIANDLKFMGEGLYHKDLAKTDQFYRYVFDKPTGLFKYMATSFRPAFSIRQAVSNSVALAINHSFGALDPRIMRESAYILAARHSADGGEMLAKMSPLRNALGQKYTAQAVLDLAERHGVLRGVSIEGLGSQRFTSKMEQSFKKELAVRGFTDNKAAQGFLRVIRGSWKYTDLPAVVEDFSRMSGFINGLRMGHAPEAAAKLVDKALFDYSNGLQQFERRVVKRVIPFYSYQRFAIPMMAQVFASTPGKITNLAKATNTFFKVWEKAHTEDTLTDTERSVLPGWLLEQPHSFVGFNKQMKATFNGFNSYSPLDALSWFAPQSDAPDERGGLVKAGMAMVAPWVKIPVEHLMQKDLFTGRKLNEPKYNMGPLDPEKVSANVAAAFAAGATGNVALAGLVQKATMGLTAGTPDFNKALLSSLIGWEDGVNKTTGERTVYVSPWRVHLLTSFAPGLAEVFKASRNDPDDPAVTPLQKTAEFLFGTHGKNLKYAAAGVSTYSLDLADEQNKRAREKEGEADFNPPPDHTRKGLEYRARWAEERGLSDTAEKYRKELEAFLDQQATENGFGDVRGATQ